MDGSAITGSTNLSNYIHADFDSTGKLLEFIYTEQFIDQEANIRSINVRFDNLSVHTKNNRGYLSADLTLNSAAIEVYQDNITEK